MAASKVARFGPSQSLCPPSSFPKGYLTTGLHCGIKKSPSALDLAVVLSSSPRTAAAGCFTRNAFKAAPVRECLDTLKVGQGWARGVVVNSGCANAVTGSQGLKDAKAMTAEVDRLLLKSTPAPAGQDAPQTLVMSTGVIGQLLPIRRILSGIQSASSTLSSSYDAWLRTAQAFMTTDTFPKLRTASYSLDGKGDEGQYRFVGIDKGAGMIHPSMAAPSALHGTLLGLVATDAPIAPEALQTALTHAVERSFNSISVDGDMSTNDTILALANGAAASSSSDSDLITESSHPAEYARFVDALTSFCVDLSSLIVRDGEGATKFVKITVSEAPSYSAARAVASTVAQSALVKTAMHGEDANWGRILCAVGYAGVKTLGAAEVDIVPEKVNVSFVSKEGDVKGELRLLVNGEPEIVDEERAKELLTEEELEISIRLGQGTESATYYTCDFSKEYIGAFPFAPTIVDSFFGLPALTAINADYRS